VSFETAPNSIAGTVVLMDTTGAPRRDVNLSAGLNSILALRAMADGTMLVLAQRTPNQVYTLFRLAADNSYTALVDIPGLRSIIGGADISPDGTRIAYVVSAAPSGLPELRVISVPTGIVTVLEPISAAPRWSPQGDRIAYIAQDGLAIINPDRTGRRLAAAGPLLGTLAWSPDATYILATTSTPGVGQGLGSRVIRVSDGAGVDLRFRSPTGVRESYLRPDWR
jgi:Tol biopolymer transport system component